jgi:hypothetical protein
MKNTTVYFTGKVLNVKEIASDNAKSFRFTKEERKKLDLRGLPIRLEHEDNLEVGTIQANWNGNDNQHWVFGKIDKTNIPATFAKYALQKTNDSQKPYYTGLSLQHVHRQYENGACEKKGIEVSLCTDPRRPNCNIIWSKAITGKQNYESENMPYKLIRQLASRNNTEQTMAETNTAPSTETTTEQMTEAVAPSNIQAQEQAPTGKELSEEVYKQFADLMEKEQAQQNKIKALEEALAKHNETLELERKKKQDEDAAKGRALMSTFLEHVKELVGDQETDLQSTVEPLIKANPEGMGKVMEIVNKASKKYQESNLALRKAEASLKDKELELKFQQLIGKQALGASAAPVIIEEKASKKRIMQQEPKTVTQKAAAAVVNPYKFQNTQRQMQQRRRGGMNENLLKMYRSSKGAGLRAMEKLHKGMEKRQSQYY